MVSIPQRIKRLEVVRPKSSVRALNDAERAVRLAALKPGTHAYSTAWAIVLGSAKHDQKKMDGGLLPCRC